MDKNYIRLIKKIKDEKGEDCLVCFLQGTKECKKYDKDGCPCTKFIESIKRQLYEFEETYLEEDVSETNNT